MTPAQQSALEALAGRTLTADEVAAIEPLVVAWAPQAIADILSLGRTEVRSRIISARGIAELMPGGPLTAEALLLKLEGARDAMLAGTAQQQVFGSLLRRQLKRLDDDGLDIGSPALRQMLDELMAAGVLTAGEVAALKDMAARPAPVTHMQVALALKGAA